MQIREVKIRRIEEGQAFDLLGARFLVKASSAETDGKFCVCEMVVPPRAGVPVHRHPYAEVFYILGGQPDFCRIQNGVEQWAATRVGETVVVPPGVLHGVRNRDNRPARLIVVATSQHESFFEDAGAPSDPSQPLAPTTEAEVQRVIRIAARHEVFTG
jgi:quercetin dioxygenase-like cupin family protein